VSNAVRWIIIVAIDIAVLLGLFLALRAPIRMWRRDQRRSAILVALGACLFISILAFGKQAGP